MPITVDWSARIINVPKDYLVQQSATIYQMDIMQFKDDVVALQASEAGMVNPDAIRHNSKVQLGNVTIADVVLVINGYTVTFENGIYAVDIVGANSNISDVLNLNYVSVRSYNSAGLQVVSTGSGLSTEEHDKLMALPQAVNTADAVWEYTR